MSPQAIVELLAAEVAGPCVSIYLPTHRRFPERRQNTVRYRNLMNELDRMLSERSVTDPPRITAPLRALLDDDAFWHDVDHGLAVFAADGLLRTMRLPRPVPQALCVDRRFHVRPLLRLALATDRYQLLWLTRREIRLFEGDADALAEIDPAPGVPRRIEDTIASTDGVAPDPDARIGPPVAGAGGLRGRGGTRDGNIDHRHGTRHDAIDPDVEIFFRAVDREVHALHSRPSGLPLLVAGVPENTGPFLAASTNPQRVEPGIDGDPASMPVDTLREHAARRMAAHEDARIAALLERYGAAAARGLALAQIDEAAAAATEGRVDLLMLEAPPPSAEGAAAMVDGEPVVEAVTDDALDAIAGEVLRTGGTVSVVPPGRLSSPARLKAILRY